MEKRLQQFLSAENLTQSQFAESIGVAKASVSHILAGRNKPGFDFMEGVAKCYPDLSLEWLITGKGKMYRSQNVTANPLLFNKLDDTEKEIEPVVEVSSPVSEPVENPISDKKSDKPNVSRILVLYDDGTYKEI